MISKAIRLVCIAGIAHLLFGLCAEGLTRTEKLQIKLLKNAFQHVNDHPNRHSALKNTFQFQPVTGFGERKYIEQIGGETCNRPRTRRQRKWSYSQTIMNLRLGQNPTKKLRILSGLDRMMAEGKLVPWNKLDKMYIRYFRRLRRIMAFSFYKVSAVRLYFPGQS